MSVNFPKKQYKCFKCGHIWEEFLPMKCPNCDCHYGIKEYKEK